jgi:hypothetical protein
MVLVVDMLKVKKHEFAAEAGVWEQGSFSGITFYGVF